MIEDLENKKWSGKSTTVEGNSPHSQAAHPAIKETLPSHESWTANFTYGIVRRPAEPNSRCIVFL